MKGPLSGPGGARRARRSQTFLSGLGPRLPGKSKGWAGQRDPRPSQVPGRALRGHRAGQRPRAV